MLFIPTLFLLSFCAKLKISSHPIPTVYGSNDRTARFPTLHSQLLIIKNGGHNIEAAMCIYISLAERPILNKWAHTFPSLKYTNSMRFVIWIQYFSIQKYLAMKIRPIREGNSWIYTNAITVKHCIAKIVSSCITLSTSFAWNCFGLEISWKIRKKQLEPLGEGGQTQHWKLTEEEFSASCRRTLSSWLPIEPCQRSVRQYLSTAKAKQLCSCETAPS